MTARTILVVDDEPDSVDYLKAILEGEDTRVLSARNGEIGLEVAREERPDLIILDVQMPKKDGFTVFAELSQEETTREIPVLMLTGLAEKTGVRFSKSDMGDFLGVEPEGYIEKPVDPAVLRRLVEETLGD